MNFKSPFLNHLLIVALFAICNTIFSQEGLLYNRSLNNLIVEQWTTERNLITNKIINLKQASDGYLWLVTYDGILRFDGMTFDHYNSANTEEMGQDTYYDVLESTDSTLWFFSRGDGILYYKNGQFSRLEVEGLPKSMRSIFIDSKQRLWVAGFENVYVIEDSKIRTINHPSIINGETLTIAENNKGVIYFGTSGKGVITYDGTNFKEFTTENGLRDNIIISMCGTSNNEMVVGTFFGVSIIYEDTIRNIPFVDDVRVNDIFIDDNNNLLIGSDIGLFRINESLEIYEKITEGNKLPTREINGIEIDHEGSIWLATERGGLVQLKSGKILTYNSGNGLTFERVNIIQQLNEHEYWVGSDAGDIDVINTQNKTVNALILDASIGGNGIRDILFDDHVTWVGTYNGLLKIENGKSINFTDENNLSSKLVRRVMKDSKDNIWVATRSGGVNRISSDGTIDVFDKHRGLKSNYILTVFEQGNLIYLGTNRGGIAVIDENDNVSNYENMDDEFADAIYFNIRSDTSGRILVAGSNGLFLFENETFKKIQISASLGTNSFFDVLDDGKGSLWMTTSKGVVQIASSEVEKYISGVLDEVSYKLYNNKDGLPSSECTAATPTLMDFNGNLWIPTNGGVGVLDPSTIKTNTRYAPTYIKYFNVDDELYPLQDKSRIVVKPGHIRYSFGFTALSYMAPENIQFKYRLTGVDKDWNFVNGTHREIQYTNIDPGEYRFEVFATNNDGLWNPKSSYIDFIVEPYIYQTLWFFLLLIVLVVTTFILAARWRVARVNERNVELQKLNAELDSFVYSTSHDLRAPLASMLGLLNIAKLDDDPTQKNSYMELMELSIKKLDSFIQDIIDYSRNTRLEIVLKNFNIKIMIEEILEELKYMDPDKLIKKHLVLEGNEQVHGDNQRIKVILNNIISNALKYYDVNKGKCEVRITIKNGSNELFIEVADNGIGIEKEQIKHVFDMFYRATENSKGSGIGLYIVKETIDKLGGTVTVHSIHGKETTFKVRIPAIL